MALRCPGFFYRFSPACAYIRGILRSTGGACIASRALPVGRDVLLPESPKQFAAVRVRSPSCGRSEEIPIVSEFLRRHPSPGVALQRRAECGPPAEGQSHRLPLTFPHSPAIPEQKQSPSAPSFLSAGGLKGTDAAIFVQRQMSQATASGGLRDQSLKNPLTLTRGYVGAEHISVSFRTNQNISRSEILQSRKA